MPSAEPRAPRFTAPVGGAVQLDWEPFSSPTDDDPGGQGGQDTGEAQGPQEPPLVAVLTADVVEGEYPLVVSFDASASELGTGAVQYEWDFGDGVDAFGYETRDHTYVGKGEFEASLRLIDNGTGEVSIAEVTIDVDTPDCPNEQPPLAWGTIEGGLDAVSGLAASRREVDLFWLAQDNDDDLAVVDSFGVTVSEHDLPGPQDLEDIAIAVDPNTGASVLFVADIGDNFLVRDQVEVWVAEEPDPLVDSDIDPLRMELEYPDEPHNAETLLVDPLTLDVYIVTKDSGVDQSVYVKRAPHDSAGPFELEDLGSFSELDMTATGGDVSSDGYRVVVRDYSTTARMWYRDGYEPLEEAFDDEPCRIDIVDDSMGEGAAFTWDGRGIVTINEGTSVPLYYVELD